MHCDDITTTVTNWITTDYCYGAKWEKRYDDERNDEIEVIVHININICGKLLRVTMSQMTLNIESDIRETVKRMDRVLQGIEGEYMKALE